MEFIDWLEFKRAELEILRESGESGEEEDHLWELINLFDELNGKYLQLSARELDEAYLRAEYERGCG